LEIFLKSQLLSTCNFEEYSMEKQKIVLGLIATLVCSSLMISGCTQQNSPSDQNKPSTETVRQILEKAKTIESVYFEVNISELSSGVPVQNVTMKIWQKTPYMKENASYSYSDNTTNVSYIQRPEGIYQYVATQNKYVLYQEIGLPQLSTGDVAEDLLNNQTITILGTESINGITTTVIQYSSNESENSTRTMKMWIWNEKGVPLKVFETRIRDEITITWDYQYLNYSFIDIPDSTFNVE